MLLSFGVLAAAALMPPGAAPHPFTPARPMMPLHTLFSFEDYPLAARRYDQQGQTGVVLGIAATGRVDDCVVASSSGHAALDTATCRLLVSRARFTPARDQAGRTVRDRYGFSIRWVLPPRPVAPPVTPTT